ncbi:MotA/TolQ/ExbB proton channel family protein [Luteimonas sp. SJ-92]|uniref:MotA/TolQ/ExbB proton channel family protein n=1 Tax=Luteimonas salinisoli TaxID=2752307 RepID=A0A853J885_9GAMM|nr:MotA/TolQ/ExbB proton channel family protein [Luteimonas salinisoli]NZA24954.1 MotA/TolQ/ExbB proton channel family protein [Luteimonas salinisoli]
MNGFESALYHLAHVFLVPVLVLVVLALVYSFIALGAFAVEAWQRRGHGYRSALAAHHAATGASSAEMELWVMRQLEWLRITARSAPMLGLVATMIPMGPALMALTRNEAASVGEHLVVAFSSVILALVSASIAFLVLTVRRRWLLQELVAIERAQSVQDGAVA